MYVKIPNLRGGRKYKLHNEVYTVEYIQEKVSFQPDLVEEEDNRVVLSTLEIYLIKFRLTAKLDSKY